MTDYRLDPDLDDLEARIDAWLARARQDNPVIAAVDRGEAGARRWYVRMVGEEKDVTTVWLTLGQRTLAYETYVLPAPPENPLEVYELLLRRNVALVGAQFAIGEEDAVFLVGHLPLDLLAGPAGEAELDRVLGTLYAAVERSFPALVRLAFASRFR